LAMPPRIFKFTYTLDCDLTTGTHKILKGSFSKSKKIKLIFRFNDFLAFKANS